MICDERKYIFVHVSRAAGTSIERTLQPDTALCSLTGYLGNTRFSDKHWPASRYAKACPEQFETYFKFAVVRNPWMRLVDNYKWLVLVSEERRSFKKWILEEVCTNDEYLFSYMLCDDSGDLIVDYVARFESMQAHFDHVCRTLDLPPMILPHHNKLPHRRHYSLYFDDETVAATTARFAWVINQYKYRFDNAFA